MKQVEPAVEVVGDRNRKMSARAMTNKRAVICKDRVVAPAPWINLFNKNANQDCENDNDEAKQKTGSTGREPLPIQYAATARMGLLSVGAAPW